MITTEELKLIEHKLDLIINWFGIPDIIIAPDIKDEISRKVIMFQKKRKKGYNGGHERETIWQG